MEDPAARAAPSLPGNVDAVTAASLVAVFAGWFLSDTLVASLGSLRHGVRFYELWAVTADPTRILFGGAAPVQRVLFGIFCLAAL